MDKNERIKEMLENPSEHMYLIKDTYVVNDFESILYNEIEEDKFSLGVTGITDNNIVQRGLSDGGNLTYITQILSSIPRLTSLKLVCCLGDNLDNKESRKEVLTLLKDTFDKYKPTSIDLKKSKFIMIDTTGSIEYENKEYIEEQDKKIK